MRPDVKPSTELNFSVRDLNDEEAVAACYMHTNSKIVNGGKVYVAGNWLATIVSKNEHFLSAKGLSPTFSKGNLPRGRGFLFTAGSVFYVVFHYC